MAKVTYSAVKPLIEGFKETGRVVVVALVSWLLTEGIISSVFALIFKDRLSSEAVLLIVGLFTAILKGIDRDLHLTGKLENNTVLTGGLTRF